MLLTEIGLGKENMKIGEAETGPAMTRFFKVFLWSSIPITLIAVGLSFVLEPWIVILLVLPVVIAIDIPLALAAARERNQSSELRLEREPAAVPRPATTSPARAAGRKSSTTIWIWIGIGVYTLAVLGLLIWLDLHWLAAILAIGLPFTVVLLLTSFKRSMSQTEKANYEGVHVEGVIARSALELQGSEQEVKSLVLQTISSIPRFKSVSTDGTLFSVRARPNFYSWGQRIVIAVKPHEGYCTLSMECRPSLSTTMYDWGQSAKDLAVLSAALKGSGQAATDS